MNLTERQIEDVFELFHSELIEEGLLLIERQHIFDNRLRADLIFQDKNNIKVIVELKRTPVSRENIGQLLEYHGLFDTPKIRVILASPFIPETMKKTFDHFGIEYLEFSLTEIENFYEKIKNKPKQELETIELPNSILTLPLVKKIIDGNVAFKVTYNDQNWMNVCSKDIAEYNFQRRTWCKIQSVDENNCQNPKWSKLIETGEGQPCADCIALRYMQFYPGHFHGSKHSNEPKRCLGAKMGKFALFTSKEPGANETDRFIFYIGKINEITTLAEDEYETIGCDMSKFIYFPENDIKFWKYFRNTNTDKIAWNSGLFRYVDDKTVRLIFEDIIRESKLDKETLDNAKEFLNEL